jgi:mRNA-degrading endonuclease RelE of RelBE toxin-antitoxin system
MRYRIAFAESVLGQMAILPARDRASVLDAIEALLQYEPLVETRNRKPLRPNPVAPWELRVGRLRVFYEIAADTPATVRVLAVGRKTGNKLFIGGTEIQL